jgi:Conjugal transfer protein TraD
MTRRAEASQRRTDNREWMMARRERTRHLIELGGLVQKAGLVELTDDDRAMMFGAFLRMAELLNSEEGDRNRILWRRTGKRAFEEDAVTQSGAPKTKNQPEL